MREAMRRGAVEPVGKKLIYNVYVRIFGLLMVITLVASFYIYQRVWVRNLVAEIDSLETRNDAALLRLVSLREEWTAASSLARLEESIKQRQLGLRPTLPAQNYAVTADPDAEGRFVGVVKAWEKLKGHLPVVSPNEAGAQQLFEKK